METMPSLLSLFKIPNNHQWGKESPKEETSDLSKDQKKVLRYLQYYKDVCQYGLFEDLFKALKTKEIIQINQIPISDQSKFFYNATLDEFSLSYFHCLNPENQKGDLKNSQFSAFWESRYSVLTDANLRKTKPEFKIFSHKILDKTYFQTYPPRDKHGNEKTHNTIHLDKLLGKPESNDCYATYFKDNFHIYSGRQKVLAEITTVSGKENMLNGVYQTYHELSCNFSKIQEFIQTLENQKNKPITDYNRQESFDIYSKYIEILEELSQQYLNILDFDCTAAMGAFTHTNEKFINEQSFPISLPLKISLKKLNNDKIILKPMGLPNVSQKNILIEEDDSMDNTDAHYSLMIKHTDLMEGIDNSNYDLSSIFDGNFNIINKSKWTSYLEWLQKKFHMEHGDNFNYHSALFICPLSSKNSILYEAYKKAIDTLKYGKVNVGKNVLGQLIGRKLQSPQNLDSYSFHKNTVKGLLKENKVSYGNDKYDHYGLNENQHVFSEKLEEFIKEQFNSPTVALNGPPGTGKTTVLQSNIASFFVQQASMNKDPLLIFGCSATNQAMKNIIGGFDVSEVETENSHSMFRRWIGVKGKQYYKTIGYGLSLAKKTEGNLDAESILKYFKENIQEETSYYVDKYLETNGKEFASVLSITQQQTLNTLTKLFPVEFKRLLDEQWGVHIENLKEIDHLRRNYKYKKALNELSNDLHNLLKATLYSIELLYQYKVKINAGFSEKIYWLQMKEKQIQEQFPEFDLNDSFMNENLSEEHLNKYQKDIKKLYKDIFLASISLDEEQRNLNNLITSSLLKVRNEFDFLNTLETSSLYSLLEHETEAFVKGVCLEEITSYELPASIQDWFSSVRKQNAHHNPERIEEFQDMQKSYWRYRQKITNEIEETAAKIPYHIGRQRIEKHQTLETQIKEMDDVLTVMIDNTLKPLSFHLAARRFECQFLQGGEHWNWERDKHSSNTEKSIKQRYTHLSKLFPIFVSTLHSLSKNVEFYNPRTKESQSNAGFIDLLVIDEAGQVPMETGAIGLWLSKRVVSLGDSYQIEPVFNIDRANDYKIFVKNTCDNENTLAPSIQIFGEDVWNCHNTSVLKICQQHTPWHQEKDLERGLYLLEHNRCPIELISYCDELKYKNKLKYSITSFYSDSDQQPAYSEQISSIIHDEKRGFSVDYIRNNKITKMKLILPNQKPFKLINCIGDRGRSGVNDQEVRTILGWIDENYEHLSKHAERENKSLSQLIAIITPFKKQSSAFSNKAIHYSFKNEYLQKNKKALFNIPTNPRDRKEEANGEKPIIVGTVHSLQGAEIPIVLFSNTYGENENVKNPFIDRQNSIINVAVSRAKQSFYVFGNRRFFEKFENDDNSATGLLYSYIKKYE